MRIWSLHPKYLDAKGIVALWREALLAKHVLLGKTKGYKNHPQLNRFKKLKHPVEAIDQYLAEVLKEATARGYQFDGTKVSNNFRKIKINVTDGQLEYEAAHLLKKLKQRDPRRFREFNNIKEYEPHPSFKMVKGEIEDWEKF
jgi:hypothetical protein